MSMVQVRDDCVTVADALARSRAVRARLKAQRAAPENPKSAHSILAAIQEPPAAPIPEPAPPIARRIPRQKVVSIVRLVAHHYGVREMELVGFCRWRKISRIRHTMVYLASKLCGHSYAELGRRLNRDHTTIIYAIRRIEALRATDTQLAADLVALELKLIEPPAVALPLPPATTPSQILDRALERAHGGGA